MRRDQEASTQASSIIAGISRARRPQPSFPPPPPSGRSFPTTPCLYSLYRSGMCVPSVPLSALLGVVVVVVDSALEL